MTMRRHKPRKPIVTFKELAAKGMKSADKRRSKLITAQKSADKGLKQEDKMRRKPITAQKSADKGLKQEDKTRRKPITAQKSAAKRLNPEVERPSNAGRSAYFARREAAKVLRSVLQGAARRLAVGSIKSLVYSPSVRNKRATFALVCQTLKYFHVINDVMEEANVLSARWKKQKELMQIITYDLLFGQEVPLIGDAENFVMLKKDTLQSALSRILKRKGVKNVEDLVAADKVTELRKPRYVRVNTLKIDKELAISELKKQYEVQEDDIVPDLLILPPGADLHNHPLVRSGSIFLQGKASCMAAQALGHQPGWEVIDACAAPGNKTLHLAALMKGKGKIIACELNRKRFRRLEDNVKLAGATNVQVMHEDFLNLDPNDPSYSRVKAILLDPSCSGSGTAFERLDHLLPSHGSGNSDQDDKKRLEKLMFFQKKALEHALSFPSVERIVYSTCSIHQIENEDVVSSVLDLATSHGFRLETPFPQWPRRGLPTFDGSHHLLRTDPELDKEGFFIALFVREAKNQKMLKRVCRGNTNRSRRTRPRLHILVAKMLKMQPHTCKRVRRREF